MRASAVLLVIGALLQASGVAAVLGASGSPTKMTDTVISGGLAMGKALYRTYCGQCHALTPADAAGLGSGNGLGQNGGQSFTNLRVPTTLAIGAVTALRGPRAHRIALKQMTWQQLHDIANFLAAATETNTHIARLYGN